MKKMQVRGRLTKAIRSGALVRPSGCQQCGSPPTRAQSLHGHHYLGYAPEHALTVQWLSNAIGKQTDATVSPVKAR